MTKHFTIHQFATEDAVDRSIADYVIHTLNESPQTVLGFATGSSPIGLYKNLVQAHQEGKVSFAQATSFNLDEYCGLPADHPESYHTFMSEQLFAHIDLPVERQFIPRGDAADYDAECERFEQKLIEYGYPDLQILGLGLNGHIGFNEPAAELHSYTHRAILSDETREANARFFDSKDEVPTHAITMGVGSILKAKAILLIVKGAAKAEILQRSLQGTITTDCPATLLQTHPNLHLFVDEEAGRLLS